MHRAANVRIQMHRIDELHFRKHVGQPSDCCAEIANSVAMIFATMRRDQDHRATRNVAVFSTDIDSFDFKLQSAEHMIKGVLAKLDKKGKGIILMHDVQPGTAKALPMLLAELKARGYRIVHLKPKGELKSLAEYDAMIESSAKGLGTPGAERPTSSVVKTIEPAAAAAVPVKKP